MDWRVFWRIIFDVINGAPRLLMEMTLWEFSAGNNRLERSVTDLTPGITIIGNVQYGSDRAVFKDGYLDCVVDLDIEEENLLNAAGIPLPHRSVRGRPSISLRGENVNIRADVVINRRTGVNLYPIFYFPQPGSDGIRLLERFGNSENRSIRWKISGQPFASSLNFKLDPKNPQHRIRVEQDSTNDAAQDKFELLIDSVPLGESTTTPDHQFNGLQQHFLIGKARGHSGGLFGEIAHLDFDPNGGCKNCPTAPKDDE